MDSARKGSRLPEGKEMVDVNVFLFASFAYLPLLKSVVQTTSDPLQQVLNTTSTG